MKTQLLITTNIEVEHGEFTVLSNIAVTDAANVGAQAIADALINASGAIVGKQRRAPSRVVATPSSVVTCDNGHKHDLRMSPWSNENVRPEQAIGQVD